MFHEDGFKIRDIAKDIIISVPLMNHYFSTAFVWENKVYNFYSSLEERNLSFFCEDANTELFFVSYLMILHCNTQFRMYAKIVF